MVKVCPKCGTNADLTATGDLENSIMNYHCQNCGHKFSMMVIEIPVETLEKIAKGLTKS